MAQVCLDLFTKGIKLGCSLDHRPYPLDGHQVENLAFSAVMDPGTIVCLGRRALCFGEHAIRDHLMPAARSHFGPDADPGLEVGVATARHLMLWRLHHA